MDKIWAKIGGIGEWENPDLIIGRTLHHILFAMNVALIFLSQQGLRSL